MSTRAAATNIFNLCHTYERAIESGQLLSYHKRRWARSQEFSNWITQTALATMSTEQALALYRASGGNRPREFETNSIEEIRDSLDFLLYDTIKLESRFDECVSADGAYTLSGTGKEFVSYLLCLRESALFAVWNSYTERALHQSGWFPLALKRGHWGLRYIDLLDAMQCLRQQLNLKNFQEVDMFCYAVDRPNRLASGLTTGRA